MNAIDESMQNAYNQLSYYTLNSKDKTFMHQHIVDGYIAQYADINTKPISLIFALAGLYLYIDKKYAGLQVQRFHMQMAKNKKIWPPINLPQNRGALTVIDVLKSSPGDERDKKIFHWCKSIWEAYEDVHKTIIDLTAN